MKTTIQSPWTFPEDLKDKVKGLKAFFDSKSEMYGNVLDKGGYTWRVLGFPVDDDLLQSVSNWLCGLCWNLFIHVDREIHKERDESMDSSSMVRIICVLQHA
jgi:hypothetical protein